MEADAFCRSLYPRLVGSLRLAFGVDVAAEDLAQETLARAIERWDRVVGMDHPEAWCYQVAFNLARSRFRRRQAERRATERLASRAHTPIATDSAETIDVRRAIDTLPKRQRQAIILRFYSDLTVDRVAQAMSCKPGTAKAHLHHGIVALRQAGLTDSAGFAPQTPQTPHPTAPPAPPNTATPTPPLRGVDHV